ncbi:MAG: ArsR family transcriptional regulator [Methanobacteriota archaeon]
MGKAQDLETQRTIYQLVLKNPGMNLTGIAAAIGLSPQLVDYHLHIMMQQGLLSDVKEEHEYKRYFAVGKIGSTERRVLSLARQDVPVRIIFFLLDHPFARYRDILGYLQLSSPRLSYYLKKLVKSGLVALSSYAEKPGYVVTNEFEVIRLLVKYKPSQALKMIKDTWEDFGDR